MINTLLEFLFMLIGFMFAQVGFSQILYILIFGIPFTKKLNTCCLLNNNILKRYILTIFVWGGITILVSTLVFNYTGISLKIGYSVGFVLSSLKGLTRCGWTKDNMMSYFTTYEKYLKYSIDDTVNILSDESGYVGELKDGLANGHGTKIYADGSKYVGGYKDGVRNGLGTSIDADGTKFTGVFKDCIRAHGIVEYANGEKYDGNFEDDMFNGYGTFTLVDGSAYAGEFKDGWADGEGTYTFANGDKYLGSFKHDQFHVYGILTYADGTKKEEEFEHGVYVLDMNIRFNITL
jgi:hypothetical protein